jgi:hypothetical protein
MAEIAERKEPTDEDIKAGYGFVALIGDSVPEVRDILNRAVKEKWTPDRFVMSVATSNWWRNTSPGQRDWVIKWATDPAAANAEADRGANLLQAELSAMGIGGLGPDPRTRLRNAWAESIALGYNDNETARRSWLFNKFFDTNAPAEDQLMWGGRHSQLVRDAFQMAHDYGYESNDLTGEVLRWVNGAFASGGTADIGGWQSGMIQYAESKFAPYAQDIRGGKTVADIARPIVDRLANLLEMNPESVNLNDPLMKKALTEWGAENRAYSLNEIENFARQDVRWRTTDNAMESSVKLLNELGQTFGVLGGGR